MNYIVNSVTIFNLRGYLFRVYNLEVKNSNTVDDVIHACMLQLSLKADLKRFGKKGEEAAKK